ncbi:tubby-like protein 8 [Impatiens glandulifera]|uniref:tubby-like protein 8 n=1 Tax=Impatiens glandulifera TaxID=253017 RepID=UPI001FB0D57B|nr:tubby-like protein 8 [Impatiens glandulifera]
MSGPKNNHLTRQSSFNSLYINPLNELNTIYGCCDVARHSVDSFAPGFQARLKTRTTILSDDKENAAPSNKNPTQLSVLTDKENILPNSDVVGSNPCKDKVRNGKSCLKDRALKPSSLQLCMQQNELEWKFGYKIGEPLESEKMNSGNIWDYSDSETAPASSWSTLPNRTLLCRPLSVDIGRCTCVIVKEDLPQELDGGTLYSLYTKEGHGRQNRKLAVAYQRRRNGRSQFLVAQNLKGITCNSDDSFLGFVTSNLMGSKYSIWDQDNRENLINKQSKPPLAVVLFTPTIATWTGNYRSMRACTPKHHSMMLKNNSTQIQHISGLPKDWEVKLDKVHQLYSRVPVYNRISKQYELDYREKGSKTTGGMKIQRSVKNFQLTMEKNGKQTILQLGRVGKSEYVMDFRYPLTGYQAFCMCLTSIDSKLCCAA